MCFPLQDRRIQRTYDSFSDLPAEGPTVRVYALEEIVIEKLLALSDRARNEPRDLYDLWYLFDFTDCLIAEMRAELDAKLTIRKRAVAGIEKAISAKEDRLRRSGGWNGLPRSCAASARSRACARRTVRRDSRDLPCRPGFPGKTGLRAD